MKAMNEFSLRALLETLFTSQDPTLTNTSNKYVFSGRFLAIMDLWWAGAGGFRNQEMCDWTMDKAAGICSREAGWLAERASAGPYEEEAKFLHVSACNVTVQMVNDFRLANLTKLYARVLPQLQKILDAVVAKKDELKESEHVQSRDPAAGKTLITSALLNLRSRRLNYHAAMNSLIFWDNRVSKRLIRAFNMFGITSSSTFQSLAVTALSKSSLASARKAANDPTKIKMLPYDNFNWISHAWEATALHGSITHDQVSVLLAILPTPTRKSAQNITDISHFSC
ncbi:hypothetical protein D9619_013675 [Psilocybe cf. subviscida]|uniref:Uncharacterized protein n=1 Tax=Psilocybe cf. subviscida TaxID=2480587 RepID=A0A8H5AZG1_9AGAR|nr:hypothetical protein D9619_013675 [Psilocybe cf. subviscida]